MTRLKPPVYEGFGWIELRREIRDEDLTVTVPTGDSYVLTLAEVRLYLKQLKVPELRAEKALDKVWNFYAIRLHLSEEKDYLPETLKPPQYPEVLGPRPLDPVKWIIEERQDI